ncbi:MAG: class I SAM-dependent methyltransferase [Burkholderiales bacterium]|nr:class I SAM-dependent methyltransferase [Burkholderiales bacterium]
MNENKTSRSNPSARHLELMALYQRLHREGEKFLGIEANSTYPGASLLPHVGRIKELIDRTGSRTILDYGCGKGYQYDLRDIELAGVGRLESVIDYWDVDEIRCYDPCYERFSKLPEEKFDGVISTDVLEHCTEEDLPWIVEEIFSYATRFVFANIACYPAKTRLPNGENAHCTVRPPEWWKNLFGRIAETHPQVQWIIQMEQ